MRGVKRDAGIRILFLFLESNLQILIYKSALHICIRQYQYSFKTALRNGHGNGDCAPDYDLMAD